MLANPVYHKVRRPRQSHTPLILVSGVLLLALLVGLVCLWLMFQAVISYYGIRVYPNVYVMGVKLGQLTLDESTAVLGSLPTMPDTGLLVVRDGDNRWSIPWSQVGMQLDVEATVQTAFAIGHTGNADWCNQFWDWLKRHDVAPVFTIDPAQARQLLLNLAPSLAVPPTDATVRLPRERNGPALAVPGRPGRELDVDATLARLVAVADGRNGADYVDMVFRTVPPQTTDVSPLLARVEDLLRRQITVSTYDLLTDETLVWELGREEIVTWLQIAPAADGPAVTLDRGGVEATLARLAAGLGAGRGFRPQEAAQQLLDAFNADSGSVVLYLAHPTRTHTVKAGDTLSGIAAAYGMTAWHILQANPSIQPDWLVVGQEVIIPSQDELTPYSPVPGKRVVVSTSEQRLRAYENQVLVFDWPISTGISTSPTHTGVFQVLSKDENAYASLWDLWMPHFVAIYAAGPGFYNGFHGLPTLSSGRRLWEGLLGSPASYGCIILGLEEAATFYRWAEVGVVVVVE